MSSTEKFLNDFNQAWARGDIPGILEGVTDDIDFRIANKPPITGRKDFAAMLEQYAGHCEVRELTINDVIIDGDRAAVAGQMIFAEAEGMPPGCDFCDIYRLRDGKVARLTAYVMDHEDSNATE